MDGRSSGYTFTIIRCVMLNAARKAGLPARRISFKLLIKGDLKRTYELLLEHLVLDQVVERPGRQESRKCKRRS